MALTILTFLVGVVVGAAVVIAWLFNFPTGPRL